jgi:hypothetical protein
VRDLLVALDEQRRRHASDARWPRDVLCRLMQERAPVIECAPKGGVGPKRQAGSFSVLKSGTALASAFAEPIGVGHRQRVIDEDGDVGIETMAQPARLDIENFLILGTCSAACEFH